MRAAEWKLRDFSALSASSRCVLSVSSSELFFVFHRSPHSLVCSGSEQAGRCFCRAIVSFKSTGLKSHLSTENLPERQIFKNARDIGFVHQGSFGQVALFLGAFRRHQMPARSLSAQNLARASHFEALGHGFLCLPACNGFWHGAKKLVCFGKMTTLFCGVIQAGYSGTANVQR